MSEATASLETLRAAPFEGALVSFAPHSYRFARRAVLFWRERTPLLPAEASLDQDERRDRMKSDGP